MNLQTHSAWEGHISEILSSPGVTVVVGAVDTGKSSFCSLLANSALKSGIRTAVVDGDLGQSEIGPPTTIGLGLVESKIYALGDLKPRSIYFVGSTSPVGHLLSSVVGVKTLADKAVSLGRELVIVDTTGLVSGIIGRKLKTSKIELLRPRHIVALQRVGEAEHFLRFFDAWEGCTIHRLPIAAGVRLKTQVLRTQRRAVKFREFFHSAEVKTLMMDGLATSGAWLKTGNTLEPKYLKFAENALGIDIMHGELADRSVYLVTAGSPGAKARSGVEQLQEYFRTRNIIIVPASRYQNLVVGLIDRHLETISLGVIKEIDFRAGSISLLTPLRSLAPVKSIRFGITKLRPDFTEIGRLNQGEL